jgi:hypothetical protein
MEKVLYDCCKILGLESKDFLPMKNAKGYPRYWSRDYGIDIKFEKNFFFGIEFQSTFFCFPDAFEIVRLVVLYFSDEIGLQLSIKEMHVALDFDDIKPADFFPKGYDSKVYHQSFKATYIPYVGGDELETFYLRGNGYRWNLAVYNKTKELRDNKSRASVFKNNYYKELGYFDSDLDLNESDNENESQNQNNETGKGEREDKTITRVELKLNSELCRMHFDAFFSASSCEDFCNGVLSSFYKKHKIYKLKKGEVFNKKRPERHQKYKIWDRIFNNEFSAPKNLTVDDLNFLESLTEEEFVDRLANLFCKSNCGNLTPDFIERVIKKAKLKRDDRFSRKEKTIKRREYILNEFSEKLKSEDVLLYQNGKYIPNTSLRSAWNLASRSSS